MSTAFDVLGSLDDLSRSRGANIPTERDDLLNTWTSIGVRLASYHVSIDLNDVVEILSYRVSTNVPGTQGWVKGITNIRGNLALIIDLKSYFGIGETATFGQSRVLFVRHEGIFVGLLVDQVVGKRHFKDKEKVKYEEIHSSVGSRYLQSFVRRAYHQNNELWLVFNVKKLLTTQRFLDVAI